MQDQALLTKLFEEEFHSVPSIVSIAGGGSPRRYYRLIGDDSSVIGGVGDDICENEVFLRLGRCLENQSIKVPHIIRVSSDKSSYLLQDLGDTSLLSFFKSAGESDKITLAKRALDNLIKIQTLNETLWGDLVGYPPFSERLIKWDLNYFKYDYLKPAGISFDEEKLEDDFCRLVKVLSNTDIITGLMYRDFQSRNIMVKDEELWFIDFQSARKGPLVYDAVSFIWQAKAPFTYEEREQLGLYYSRKLSGVLKISHLEISYQLNSMILLRSLQVLGAYGFRGLIEKKAHFLESIPLGISNLQYLKEMGYLSNYPEIERIVDKLYKKKTDITNNDILTVTVFSFSYKIGYPNDYSGNGGGFIFDCRAITNPGKYEEYKRKTGLDKEVIEFIERTDEASDFVENAVKIVSPSIKKYLQRRFTSLQVGFGCTGGRHRSVYCAEKFAQQINKLFPEIKVNVIHREQAITKVYN